MDAAALLLLLAYISLRTAASGMETFSENGWRPISSDRLFSDHVKTDITPAGWLYSANNRDFIKVVDAPNINKELMIPNIMEPPENFINNNQETSLVLPINGKVFKSETQSSNNIPFRRGKKMEIKSNSDLNKSFEDKKDNLITKDNKLETINDKTYKVIEDTDDEDLLSSDENTLVRNNNYDVYEENKRGNNFTNSLWKILSNYKIRSSDRLSNYALSLRQNSRNSNSGYVYMRVPIRIPMQHNSANHASVDPLLAVLLSNYGHYLPGVFGFQQNYKNLYGYLASNNIHNNLPFGAYKIFADTDSSL